MFSFEESREEQDKEKEPLSYFKANKVFKDIFRSLAVIRNRVSLLKETEERVRSGIETQDKQIKSLALKKIENSSLKSRRQEQLNEQGKDEEEKRLRLKTDRYLIKKSLQCSLDNLHTFRKEQANEVRKEKAKIIKLVKKNRRRERITKTKAREVLQKELEHCKTLRENYLINSVNQKRAQIDREKEEINLKRSLLEDELKELQLQEMKLLRSLALSKGYQKELKQAYESLVWMPRRKIHEAMEAGGDSGD